MISLLAAAGTAPGILEPEQMSVVEAFVNTGLPGIIAIVIVFVVGLVTPKLKSFWAKFTKKG